MESKEVRGLMEAYASVYNQDLNEQKPEPEPGSPKNLMGGLSRLTGRGPLPKPERKGGRGPVVTLGGRGPVVKSMGEQSVFDIIKGHLLDEGYADTEQAALAIMANMSEEWKQSIVEDVDAQGNRSHDLFTDEPNPNYKPTPKPKPQPKKPAPTSGYSTRPGDGKPYADGPLF